MRFLTLWAALLTLAGSVLAQPNRSALVYSTYVGGDSVDIANAIAVDAQGNIYIAGQTVSSNFPVTSGALQSKNAGTPSQYFLIGAGQVSDAFVTKIDPAGKIVYSTYLGGAGTDIAKAIAVDAQGNAYVAGVTNSANFPVTTGAFQTSPSFITNGLGQSHIFAVKLNASGSALIYSTFIAGTGTDQASAIAVDTAGNAYITGSTSSLDFPVTSGAFQTSAAKSPQSFSSLVHGYVAKLNAAGTALSYATYLSGSNGAQPNGLALASNGEVIVTGNTASTDFPVTQGAFQIKSTGSSAFISRVNSTGSGLVYSTFLAGGTLVNAVALGSADEVYVTGTTTSAAFPVTAGALQTSFPPNATSAGFVAKLNPLGNSLGYATLLGGAFTTPYAIAVDAMGNAWVGGLSDDANLPMTADAYQTNYEAAPCSLGIYSPFQSTSVSVNCTDAFLTELNPNGTQALYSTYFGGNGGDLIYGLALGTDGSVYAAGSTESANLPATAGAWSTHLTGNGSCTYWSSPTAQSTSPCSDAFVARFNFSKSLTKPFEVVNAASLLPGAIAPGELVTLVGLAIGPAQPADLTLNSSGLVSTTLAGVQVLFNGTPAPMIHVDSSNITVVTPYEVSGQQQVPVVIQTNQVSGPTETIEIAQIDSAPPVAPGLFTTASGGAACLNQDGTVNGPTNPAAQGSEVAIYLTGLGTTVPSDVDGSVVKVPGTGVSGLPMPAAIVLVYVGGKPAKVVYAGAAPNLVAGVMQVNFIVPAVSGTEPVFVAAGDANFVNIVSSQSGVSISIR